jgi:hypothetical protein
VTLSEANMKASTLLILTAMLLETCTGNTALALEIQP